MTDEKIGCLEDEALKRKERLQALKRKQEEHKSESEVKNTAAQLPKYVLKIFSHNFGCFIYRYLIECI